MNKFPISSRRDLREKINCRFTKKSGKPTIWLSNAVDKKHNPQRNKLKRKSVALFTKFTKKLQKLLITFWTFGGFHFKLIVGNQSPWDLQKLWAAMLGLNKITNKTSYSNFLGDVTRKLPILTTKRHFTNLLQCPRNNGFKSRLAMRSHFLLSFISSLNFKPVSIERFWW